MWSLWSLDRGFQSYRHRVEETEGAEAFQLPIARGLTVPVESILTYPGSSQTGRATWTKPGLTTLMSREEWPRLLHTADTPGGTLYDFNSLSPKSEYTAYCNYSYVS
ncbi:hypothetical protein RRG08_066832 [Elysia crispata]|uniref:Uncharacterized protein n=1 Tax=Elysia crispata TaxID=231223 RepID=A0AAE0XQV1_9GAST|nr:hypothetical protein RRG08_066832 [Elysia crispata]